MISYDPAAQLLHVAQRTSADAWHAVQTSAALGGVFWLLVVTGGIWALARARRDLSDRHAVALALWTTLLGSWAIRTAQSAPIVSGDEFIDYAQSALGILTGLRPVELIFPTGWTQLVAVAIAPAVWTSVPSGVGAEDPALATHLARALLDVAPYGLVLGRWLSTSMLIILAIIMGRALTLRAGAAAGIYAIGALILNPHLQPLAARFSPHIPSLCLGWGAVLMLSLGDPKQRRWAIGAGLALGYAMGSHGLAVLLVAASLPLWWRHRRVWHLAAVAMLFGVLCSNPHLFGHWAAYAASLRFRLAEIGTAEAVVDAPNANYAAKLLALPMLLVGLVMWAVALPMERRLRQWDTLGPVLTGWLMFAALALVRTRYDRYLAWVMPGLIWAAAQGYGGFARRLRSPKVDALVAGALATTALAFYAVPVVSAPCPKGIHGAQPLAKIAVLRSNAPMVLVTQMPQLGRAVSAGLLAPEIEREVLDELARRVGGRARVELRATHLGRALPQSYVALPTATTPTSPTDEQPELWELRWRRAMPLAAPLHVAGLPPLTTHHREARCGMLLRGAKLPVTTKRARHGARPAIVGIPPPEATTPVNDSAPRDMPTRVQSK